MYELQNELIWSLPSPAIMISDFQKPGSIVLESSGRGIGVFVLVAQSVFVTP